jgi:hypothetical protein
MSSVLFVSCDPLLVDSGSSSPGIREYVRWHIWQENACLLDISAERPAHLGFGHLVFGSQFDSSVVIIFMDMEISQPGVTIVCQASSKSESTSSFVAWASRRKYCLLATYSLPGQSSNWRRRNRLRFCYRVNDQIVVLLQRPLPANVERNRTVTWLYAQARPRRLCSLLLRA